MSLNRFFFLSAPRLQELAVLFPVLDRIIWHAMEHVPERLCIFVRTMEPSVPASVRHRVGNFLALVVELGYQFSFPVASGRRVMDVR